MNSRLAALQAYPFERLAKLLVGAAPPKATAPIALTIGEPRHPAPPFVLDVLSRNLDRLGSYPSTVGLLELRAACARWLERRFALRGGALDESSMVLPVNGTREALFAFAQVTVDAVGSRPPIVAMPNPFYQIYEGAALLAGAEPHFIPATPVTRFLPELHRVPASVWARCQLLYLCSPGNPTGAVMSLQYLRDALELAERHDFVIAADECYAEIYRDDANPPPSLLNAALSLGWNDFRRCMVFHSLSKRSSLPGLRSGFVAGDPKLISRFLLYRTYHGCAMSVPVQLASIAAWNDDAHAAANRQRYRDKFLRVLPILSPLLDVTHPDGGFYLWPDIHGDDQRFARELFTQQNLTVLPGSFLGRDADEPNPGAGRIRISLVAADDECVIAAQRLRDFLTGRQT